MSSKSKQHEYVRLKLSGEGLFLPAKTICRSLCKYKVQEIMITVFLSSILERIPFQIIPKHLLIVHRASVASNLMLNLHCTKEPKWIYSIFPNEDLYHEYRRVLKHIISFYSSIHCSIIMLCLSVLFYVWYRN